jgi:hypothetical protein
VEREREREKGRERERERKREREREKERENEVAGECPVPSKQPEFEFGGYLSRLKSARLELL